MLFGWALSVLARSTETLSSSYSGDRIADASKRVTLANLRGTLISSAKIVFNWKIMCLYPMFYNANIFYSYQQNNVNGATFNLRTRSLNGALYWIAQMVAGLLLGAVLDIGALKRRTRSVTGWSVLFVTCMAVWGGGYAFQMWNDERTKAGP